MKIAYMNDSHIRSSRPSCRKDENFYEMQLKKLEEAISVGGDTVDLRLHGGDLFHIFNSPLSLLNDVLPIIKGRNLLVNAGNHDYPYGNVETIKRSALGVIASAGAASLLPAKDNAFLMDDTGREFVVRSAPYMVTYPEDFYWFDKKEAGKVYAVMAHDMLSTRSCPFPHKQIKDVRTNADIVLCSHLHQQFIERVGDTWFVNSGPLDAQTVTEQRTRPAVAIIDITAEGILPSFEFLKTTGYEEIEATVEEEKDLGLADDFVRMVKDSDLADGADFQQAVIFVAKQAGYSDETVSRVLGRIKEAQTCAGRE